MRFKRGEYSEAVVPVGEGDVMCAVMDNRSLVIVTKTRKMEVLILDLKSLEEATLEVEATLLSDEIISAIDMNEKVIVTVTDIGQGTLWNRKNREIITRFNSDMYVAGVKITEDSIVTLSHSCVSVLSYNDSQGSVVMGGKIEGEDYSSIRMDADGDNLLVVLKNHLRLYDMRDRSSLRIQTDVQVEGIIYQCKLFFPYAAVTTSHRTPQLQVWNMERGQHLRTIKNNGFVLRRI